MKQVVRFATILLGVACAAGCSENKAGNATPEAAPSQTAAATTPPAATTSAAPATPPPAQSAEAKPEASAAAAPAEAASAAAAPATSAAAAPATSAAAGPKTFDCGAKGQKACPMQGWMKSVMGSATSSGDKDKIASGLAYIAGKPPPGMPQWGAISRDGAAKAKAGDIDGAKASCKKCHDLYKDKYKATMRDMPW